MAPKKALPPKKPTTTCNGRNKAHTKYCENVAGKGTTHKGVGRCSLHGGAEPHAEVNGQVVLARREAIVMGLPRQLSPGQGIIECIEIAAGERDYASAMIEALEEPLARPTSILDRPLKEEKGAEHPTERVTEIREDPFDLHIWIRVRHEAMDRLVRYEAAALKAGIEERQVRVAEGIGLRLAEAVKGILSALGVADHPKAPQVVAEHLRLLAGQAR